MLRRTGVRWRCRCKQIRTSKSRHLKMQARHDVPEQRLMLYQLHSALQFTLCMHQRDHAKQ